MKLHKKLFILLLLFAGAVLWAQEGDNETGTSEEAEKTKKEKIADYKMDEVSITATRVKRKTQDVPASIKVVGKEEIEESKMLNVKDALMGTAGIQIDSKNSGYDSRVVIRGAGAKARYGIREIMFLLNGVPITDPDGFSKLDLLDPLQIDRIEVVKGPNSTLWGVNATGGVVHIITKDPMKESGGSARVGYGQYGAADASFYYGDSIGESFVYAVNGSYRRSDNSWREWNEFEAFNITIQPGLIFKDGSTWQNYLTFNKSDVQLPGSLNEAEFEDFKDGDEPKSSDTWSKSGRYSQSLFYSTKYTKEAGSFTLKPMFFFNKWEHYHPVYAFIGVVDALSIGGDVQIDQKHIFGPVKGTLTFGVTGRMEDQESEKYKYRDIETENVSIPYPPFSQTVITGVSSDKKGDKASEKDSNTRLVGAFIQESLNIFKDLTVDLGIRYDQIDFDIDGHIDSYYSYSSSNYADCDPSETDCGQPVENNEYKIEKTFKAVSPRTGVSYRIIKPLSIYGSVAKGIQTPTDSEMEDNPELDLVTVINYEVGLKGRGKIWDFDLNVYQADLENEVVTVLNPDNTSDYRNTGKTRKRGVEFSGSLDLLDPLTLGGSFTFNDYKYVDYTELVRDGGSLVPFDRSGNHTTYAPRYIYSAFMRLKFKSGFKAKIQTDTWGPYYMDAANSEKYDGYSLITSLMLGYEFKNFTFMLNADNIFDTRYAVEAKKASTIDNTGEKSYSVGTPRSILFSLRYKF
jgi:iron complex outermembrane receptor protein